MRDDELRIEIEQSSWAPEPLQDAETDNVTEAEPALLVDDLREIMVFRPVSTVQNVPMPWFITIQNVMRWRQDVHRAWNAPMSDFHRAFANFNVSS